jgi:phosphomannomutase
LLAMFSNKDFNRDLKVVVDPGNGAASGFASELFAALGINVILINDEPDGRFPGRSPEPSSETLQGTVAFLRSRNADLAVCFDGDADRVVFCDQDGFLGFTEMVAFISRLAVQGSEKKTVVATIEVGKLLDFILEDLGVSVVRGKIGDVHLAHLLREHDAVIGVEDVGVYIIPEMGLYPDSMFAALTLLKHITHPSEIRESFKRLPQFFPGRKKVFCQNELKQVAMDKIREKVLMFKPNEINLLDGVRLDFEDSWMLIRASGTEPAIRIMAESAQKKETEALLVKGVRLVEEVVEGIK